MVIGERRLQDVRHILRRHPKGEGRHAGRMGARHGQPARTRQRDQALHDSTSPRATEWAQRRPGVNRRRYRIVAVGALPAVPAEGWVGLGNTTTRVPTWTRL